MSSKFEMSFSSSWWEREEEREEDFAEEWELDRPGGETGERSAMVELDEKASSGEGERGVSERMR